MPCPRRRRCQQAASWAASGRFICCLGPHEHVFCQACLPLPGLLARVLRSPQPWPAHTSSRGPPSIPRAPVEQPSAGPTRACRCGCSCRCRCASLVAHAPCLRSPTVIHTHATTHSLFQSLTPSFLPSLFLDLLCRSTTPSQRHLNPSQPTVASWREEDLTVFVPSFGIPTCTCSNLASHLRTPKLRLLVTPFCLRSKIVNHNPAAWIWVRISSRARARLCPCKIIFNYTLLCAIPTRRPQVNKQSLLF